jgi:hypothetical protein
VVLEYFHTNPGWHSKTNILAATGQSGVQWNTAIADLVARGHVERQGERRGTRYRVSIMKEDT